jgi:thioester reductase-like protein
MNAGTQTVLSHASHVLISGVTGLIGGELLRRLTPTVTSGTIWPLIRPTADRDPEERLRQRLERSGDRREIPANVRCVPGDMLDVDWGMDQDDLTTVTENVDIIIHNAADTSFAADRDPTATNVEGVERLIALARKCRRAPLILYMSTASNVGDVVGTCVTEDDGCRAENRHHNDYTKSKAVAEDLLRRSGLPVLTLRPTIVLSAGLPDAQFARQILWCVPITRIFEALPVDPASRVDVVDVGYVAESAIRLLCKSDRAYACYHISAGPRGAATIGEVMGLVDQHYGRKTPMRAIPPAEWKRATLRRYVQTDLQRKIYGSLRYYFPFLNMDVVYDDERLQRELGPATPVIQPLENYLIELLGLIRTQAALKEAALP